MCTRCAPCRARKSEVGRKKKIQPNGRCCPIGRVADLSLNPSPTWRCLACKNRLQLAPAYRIVLARSHILVSGEPGTGHIAPGRPCDVRFLIALPPTNMAPVGRYLEDQFPLEGTCHVRGREGKLHWIAERNTLKGFGPQFDPCASMNP